MWMWRRFDELWRQLTSGISAISGNILMLVAIIWRGPHPLDLASLAFGSLLHACFVVVGRRGMMAPR